MKKHEIKNALRAVRMGQLYKRKMMTRLLLFTMLLFAAPSVALGLNDHSAAPGAIVMLGGTTLMAGMALIGDIEDVGDQEVAGKQLGYVLHLVHVKQLNKQGFPKPNVNREYGQLPFKDGEKVISFEAHQLLTSDSKGERGDLTTENTNTVVAIMGGAREVLLNFIEEYAGGKFILLYEECETGKMYILGTINKPMILKSYERADNLEKRAITFTFENNSFKQPGIYVGTLPKSEPVAVPAGSDTLTITPDNNTYNIPSGSTTAVPITKIAGVSANDKGRTITLVGNGTANLASIEDGAVFILEGGATWKAKKGSVICLRIVDTARLVEVTGTRVQSV